MLSQSQFQPQTNEMADTTKIGAMPISNKFDGASPISTPKSSGVMPANQGMNIPKPGFF